MNIEKMCRCCLTNEGPLLNIYNDGAANNNKNTIADMIKEISKIQPDPNDKLPDKACLSCIRDINQCFSFKIKCENSNRTLQQLFCSIAKVELRTPFISTSSVHTTQAKIPPEDSIDHTHNELNISEICKEETNIECLIPKSCLYRDDATTSDDKYISVPSSPISFQNSIPNTTYLHSPKDAAEISSEEMTENQQEFSDTDTNSYDLEFLSENPEIHEPIVILDDEQDVVCNTNTVNEADEPEVELTFQNISSPQWIGEEEESFLSLVNEDLQFENVQNLNMNMENLNKHNSHVDINVGARYECAICIKEFLNKIELNNHLEAHEKPYTCVYCNNLFDDYLSLQVHLLKHTNESITLYNNLKSSLSISNLRSPKRKSKLSRKRIREKSHTCEYCQMKFYTNCVLINHRRIHTGEKPYKCRYCDRTFIQSSTRWNHEKTHTGDKRFKCQYCDKTFIQSGTRASHEKVHTGEKRYKCRFCDKRFIQQGVLQTHELTHTRERPFKCSICFKGFSAKSVQKKHEADHGEDDVKCPQCDLWFVNSTDTREHIILCHSSINQSQYIHSDSNSSSSVKFIS